MTINQPADTAAAPPVAATGRAGTPRRRLIILAGMVLAVLAGVAAAVTALVLSSAPAAHVTARPLTGTGAGTMTLNLATGAATAEFTGHLSPLGAETGHDNGTSPSPVPTRSLTQVRGSSRRPTATSCSRPSPARGPSPALPPTARRPTRSPAARAASPGPAGPTRTRSAPSSSLPPRPARPAASPLLPKDRSATRPRSAREGLCRPSLASSRQ